MITIERREIKGDKSRAPGRGTQLLLFLILLKDYQGRGAGIVLKSIMRCYTLCLMLRRSSGGRGSVVRAAYEERFVVSAKQRAGVE